MDGWVRGWVDGWIHGSWSIYPLKSKSGSAQAGWSRYHPVGKTPLCSFRHMKQKFSFLYYCLSRYTGCHSIGNHHMSINISLKLNHKWQKREMSILCWTILTCAGLSFEVPSNFLVGLVAPASPFCFVFLLALFRLVWVNMMIYSTNSG